MIFVVDACIARSMGDTDAVDPISQNCRNILMEISTKSHKIAVNDKLFGEYKDNASTFFKEWLLTMLWKRRIEDVNKSENLKLRNDIKTSICKKHKIIAEHGSIIAIVCKDVHLLESALVNINS